MAAKADGPRRCAFCGGRGLSREHVWPDWMQGVLSEPGLLNYSRVNEGRRRVETWRDAAFKSKVRCVCATCNHGWMSDLEKRAKPILTPMLLGQQADLQPDSQAVVATWAVKTALVSQYLHGQDDVSVPEAVYRRFYAEQQAPELRTWVWIGRFVGEHYAGHYHHRALRLNLGEQVDLREEPDAYLATFGVGQLVLQVLGHFLDEERVSIIGRSPAGLGIRQVWPVQSPVLWPPGRYAFNESGITALANRLDSEGRAVRTEAA